MSDDEVPEGYRREWAPDPHWRVADPAEAGRKCRHSPKNRCTNPVVAVLRRAKRDSLGVDYFYCSDHMFGRQVRDGVVKYSRLVPQEPAKVFG